MNGADQGSPIGRLNGANDSRRPTADGARPLRVLLVSSSSGSMGGGELYLLALAQELTAQQVHVEVALSTHSRMDALADQLRAFVTVHRIAYTNTYDRRLRVAATVWSRRGVECMARTFHDLNPDLVHLNKQNFEDGLDLIAAAETSKLPYLATIHITRSMTELGARGGWLRDWLARRCLNRAHGHWLTVAKSCSQDLRRQIRCPESRLHFVCNGVAPAPAASRDAIRSEWRCETDTVVLGCAARIEQQKNPLFLVRLLAELPPRARVVWIGDGRLKQDLLCEANRLGVADRLVLDGWRTDVRSRIAGFDVFVLPSLYEGLPLAALEAMATGLPCVVSDADGTREAVLDRVCGRLLPPNDFAGWQTGLTELIEDAALRATWGAAAAQRYNEYFSGAAMARGTIEVYRKVLGQRLSQ